MPLLEVTQTKHVSASIRLPEATAVQLNQYAHLIGASADEVIEHALNYVFSKDRDFQEFQKTPQARQVAGTLRVRKAAATDAVEPPAKKPALGAVPGTQTTPVAAGSRA